MDQASRRLVRIRRFEILVLGLVRGAGSAEPSFIVALINSVAPLRRFRRRDPTPEFTNSLVMKRLGGAHEDVVPTMFGVEAKLGSHLPVVTHYIISLLFW